MSTSITWSAIISGIALIAAVISPVITTILTNRHEDKVWARKNLVERRHQVITNYIRNTGKVLKFGQYEDLGPYGESFGEIYAYAPPDAIPLIEEIDQAVMHLPVRDSVAQFKFDDLCKILVRVLNEDVKAK